MKKLFLFACLIFVLLLLPACNKEEAPPPCDALGGHELQYVTNDLAHWQECVRDGCDYKTESSAHTGGTATCQAVPQCKVCGAEYGTILDHDYEYVTTPETHYLRCKSCSVSEQKEPHVGGEATCTAKAICEECGTSYGNLKDHTYVVIADDEHRQEKRAACCVNIFQRASRCKQP